MTKLVDGAPPQRGDTAPPTSSRLLDVLTGRPDATQRVRHVERIPAREGRCGPWPAWTDPAVVAALERHGVPAPWRHQIEAAEAAWGGQSVVIATGTSSGKSLAYLLPVLTALRVGAGHPSGRGATALYLSPTKALAAQQLESVLTLQLAGVRAATYDGDTPTDERRWVREHANYVLSNPDLLHRSLLPAHRRWSGFFRALRYVVVDECHAYRGIFGSHTAAVLRRLRRVAGSHGADPVFLLASATVTDPASTAGRLTGLRMAVVDADASPRGSTDVVLWQPPPLPGPTPRGWATGADEEPDADDDRPPVDADPSGPRRSALAETADLVADLAAHGARTLAFSRSRRGAETVALEVRRRLEELAPQVAGRVAAYRAGYLPEERRALEADLCSGRLLALAATTALELGIDIHGLDAVVLAGWPGTLASLWQQVGRAGRRATDAVAVLVARDEPLDSYLVQHPEAVFGRKVEAAVIDPDNPYVLAPHLCAAAAELPLTPTDHELFGPTTAALLDVLTTRGALRRRPTGWFWTRPGRAGDLVDLRGAGGEPVRLVESATGRVVGTVDATAAHHAVHPGAVYLHQGRRWLVQSLDESEAVALVRRASPDYTTHPRGVSDVRLVGTQRRVEWGPASLGWGTVDVTSQVTSYVRRHLATGKVLTQHPLDLPARTLRTRAVWWAVPDQVLAARGVGPDRVPGAVHAAEHAAIGMLPLVATCDRWDVGGMSMACHPDTGQPTVLVHDAVAGGAGFAERGFAAAECWLRATREAVAGCPCRSGCPSCVQSPKCGNGNEPLNKVGAVAVLDTLLEEAGPGAADCRLGGASGTPNPTAATPARAALGRRSAEAGPTRPCRTCPLTS